MKKELKMSGDLVNEQEEKNMVDENAKLNDDCENIIKLSDEKISLMRLMSEVLTVQEEVVSRAVFFGGKDTIDQLLRETLKSTIEALMQNRCSIRRLCDLTESPDGMEKLFQWNRILDESAKSEKRLIDFLADKIEEVSNHEEEIEADIMAG